MTLSLLFIYAIASFSVIIIPGPTMLLALTNGSTRSIGIVISGILGAVCADLILMVIIFLGLGAVLMTSETLFIIIKWIGVVYLVYLAVQLWKANPTIHQVNVTGDKQATKAFARALLVAVSNPKALLFFSALFPQFITIDSPQIPQYMVLALITTVINVGIMGCYALGGFYAAKVFSYKGLKRMNQGCASIMMSLAIFLAIYRKG